VTSASELSAEDLRDNLASAERANGAIRIMSAALDAMVEAGSVTPAPGVSLRVFPLAYGWFATVVRTGELIALAHDNRLRHESAASARLVLQHTLALQWLIDGGDPAVDAIEADRDRRAFDLVKELIDTKWPIPAELTMRPDPGPPQNGALEEQLSKFKHMCAVYDGADQLYVPFRLQSAYAHPSYVGATAYFTLETGQPSATAVTETYAHLVDTTRCVIQAGHAFATLLADDFLAKEIARAEKALGAKFSLWQRLP
jgi:hypothetical protein